MQRPQRLAGLALLLGLLLLMTGLSLTVGARSVPWAETWAGMTGRIETIGAAAVAVRMPRTALAILAGARLALRGR
ncbi:iron chelate uptake ABC transporter family permease subunit [Sulfitobacter profundi]|uniref:Iron chelate uptake ABC transporter family permease subunit n=1 Tax=Sulfitobacter profundi TaxID=2679961 RepID=A0ABW1YXQ1_9RHOB